MSQEVVGSWGSKMHLNRWRGRHINEGGARRRRYRCAGEDGNWREKVRRPWEVFVHVVAGGRDLPHHHIHVLSHIRSRSAIVASQKLCDNSLVVQGGIPHQPGHHVVLELVQVAPRTAIRPLLKEPFHAVCQEVSNVRAKNKPVGKRLHKVAKVCNIILEKKKYGR